VTEDYLGSQLANASWLAALDDFRNWLIREAAWTADVSPLFRPSDPCLARRWRRSG